MAEPATLPPPADETQLAALVAKHRTAIDAILPLTVEEQRKAIEAYGLEPAKLEKYYSNLQTENVRLRREYVHARSVASTTGWAFALATAGAMLYAAKSYLPRGFIRWGATVIMPIVSGFAGYFIGWTVTGGKQIQEQGKDLAYAARRALENELAIGIENTAAGQAVMHTAQASAAAQNPPTPPLGRYTEALAQEKSQTVPLETTR